MSRDRRSGRGGRSRSEAVEAVAEQAETAQRRATTGQARLAIPIIPTAFRPAVLDGMSAALRHDVSQFRDSPNSRERIANETTQRSILRQIRRCNQIDGNQGALSGHVGDHQNLVDLAYLPTDISMSYLTQD